MSRIGNKPIPLPKGVTVTIEGNHVLVKGPKGTLEQDLRPEIAVKQEEGQLLVTRPAEDKLHRSLHGLTRTLVSKRLQSASMQIRRTA